MAHPRPIRHRGAAINIAPELLVRQVLTEGLVELAGSNFSLDELYEREDDLLQGSQDEWTDDLKEELRRILDPEEQGGVRVLIGYPPSTGRFPAVSLVLESANENEGESTMGDVLGQHYQQIGTPDPDDPSASRSVEFKTIGAEWLSNVQVGVWATAPETSLALHAAVKAILFKHKGRLLAAGVNEVSMSESGFQPDPQLYPRTGYVPVIRCSMRWTWRQTRRTDPVPTRVTVNPGTFGN
jgi:hypothetical protein